MSILTEFQLKYFAPSSIGMDICFDVSLLDLADKAKINVHVAQRERTIITDA